MQFTKKLGALLAVIVALLGTQSFAANLDFNVPDGSWFTPTNWTPPGPPTGGDNAHIGNGTVSTSIARITAGFASAQSVFLGDAAGESGTIRVSSNSSLNIAHNFTIGDGGSGTAILVDSAFAGVMNNITIANQSGSDGSVTLHDTSSLDALGFLRVGDGGVGSLTLKDSSSEQVGSFTVGNQSGSNGTVDVSAGGFGPGITVVNNIVIGNHGTGSMDIHDGGFVDSNLDTSIGDKADGVGTVTVRGENAGGTFSSQLQILGNLNVGNAGQGNLEIRNGGFVDVFNSMWIGRTSGSVGTVLVEGIGPASGTSSTLLVFNSLFVGGDAGGPGGTGELRIINRGAAVATDMTVWGPGSGDRGTLSVDSNYDLILSGTLNFVGGRLNFVGDGVNFTNNADLTNAPGPDQNGMFANVSDGNTATISSILTGNGDLTKTGTGTLILTNNGNGYRDTNINNGNLEPGVAGDPFGLRDINVNTKWYRCEQRKACRLLTSSTAIST